MRKQKVSKDISLRKALFRKREQREKSATLPTKAKKHKLLPTEKDNIISLDVKRTHIETIDFDHVGLEQVLRNIANPEMGNFSYYQGLNYIVAYFLDLFQDDLDSYNLIVTLLERNFRKYMNQKLDNLKVLFYIMRRLVQVYLPELSNHIEHKENLEPNVIYANWFLTLFTTLKQFNSNVVLLDQIVDIFVAKGWIGFFRCCLVILYYLQDHLMTLQNEELLMYLTDFAKRGFASLGQPLRDQKGGRKKSKTDSESINSDNLKTESSGHKKKFNERPEKPVFDFKEEIKMFKAFNNLLFIEFSMEFHNHKEIFERKWIDILRKIETFNK